MDTNVQPVKAERAEVGVPTWLRVKSQVKAGSKQAEKGPGDKRSSPTSQRLRPSWLLVKSQIKAGSKVYDLAVARNDDASELLGRLANRFMRSHEQGAPRPRESRELEVSGATTPTWLRVKSHIRAGGDDPVKPGMAQGMVDNPSLTLARLSTRAKLTL
jgi:hypothetical protein